MESPRSPFPRGAGRYPDLARVVALACRSWLWLAAAVVVGAGLAATIAARSGATYEAQTRVLVGPLDGDPKVLRAAGAQAQTFSQLATSEVVLNQAQAALGQRAPGSDLLPAIRVDAAETTRLLTIKARADSPTLAAARAGAVAAQLGRLVDGRRPPGAERQLHVVDPARPPGGAVGSGRKALTAMAALAALLAGLAVALVIDYFRGRIETEDELTEVSGLPTLGTVRDDATAPRAGSEEAAVYRRLGGRVAFFGPDRRRITVMLAAAGDEAGTGAVAAGIAAALAADGRQVVLVDADRARAEVTAQFALEGREGLGELLNQPLHGRTSVRLAGLAAEPAPRLRVMPIGGPEDWVGTAPERATRALRRLARAADVVVLSVGSSASAAAMQWATLVDGTILVARRAGTTRDATARAVEALDQVGAMLLGTVLVERGPRRPWRFVRDTLVAPARARVSARLTPRAQNPARGLG